MDSLWPLIGVLIGLAIGYFAARQILSARTKPLEQEAEKAIALAADLATANAERARLEERASRLPELEQELVGIRNEFAAVREKAAQLETQIAEGERRFEEQKLLMQEAEKRLADTFTALSSDALRKNNAQFIELAAETLKKHTETGKGDLEKKQQAIDELVKPLREQLEKLAKETQEMEVKRASSYSEVTEQVKSLLESQTKLQKETGNLVQVLKNPSQRGVWGEMTLRRLVEMAGLQDVCDFTEQTSTTTEEGRLRPDMIIHLPQGRKIIVDSKAPMDTYWRANEAESDALRVAFENEHAKTVKSHIKTLGSKNYWDQFDGAADLVILFLPHEPMLTSAQAIEPDLVTFAFSYNVVLATPTTLLLALRTVGAIWRQEKLAENAKEISELGKLLYERLVTMGTHFARVGKNLDSAVGAYNQAVGSLESRVLSSARKFKELKAATREDLQVLEPVEKTVREIQAAEISSTVVYALPFEEADQSEPSEDLV